jgi:ABC-2 type transport system permease protein
MSVETETMTAAPPSAAKVRPFYWSVRRELWENRSIYIAPAVAGGLVLVGFLLSALQMVHVRTSTTGMGTGHRASAMWRSMQYGGADAALAMPYNIAAMAVLATAMIVGLFYCPGALHNERRDRSVLFWKSLPVSDLVTVMSKAAVPLAVVPVVTAAVVIATQLAMLVINAAALAVHGGSPASLLTDLPLAANWAKLIYGLIALSLWNAPTYAWLLLVSGWARRSPFLWSILPLLAVCLVEKIALDSSYFGSLLIHRLTGGLHAALPNGEIDPAAFLSNPGLWAGLVVAAGMLAATVWQRRYREPN